MSSRRLLCRTNQFVPSARRSLLASSSRAQPQPTARRPPLFKPPSSSTSHHSPLVPGTPMAHCPSPTSGSLASRSSFLKRFLRGQRQPQQRDGYAGRDADARSAAAPGHWSGLRPIRWPECARDVVEEFNVPGLGGTTTGNPSNCRRNEGGVPGCCCCFEPPEEHEITIFLPARSGEPVGNPEMVAAVEDLKHEIAAQTLAIAQLKTDIEDVKGFKGKLGAGDKVQKVAKTDSIALQGKAIVIWFFVANVVVLLFGLVVAMAAK